MINGKKILGIIPARGGSKGIQGKNIIDLGGKPLIAWTIEAAKKSRYIDRLILSSDDDKIIDVAAKFGCEVPFKRPAELAQDDTPGISPVFHALESLDEDYDFVVLLQPTSPFRIAEDIDNCIELALTKKGFAVSVTVPDKSPYWMYKTDNGYLTSLLETEAVRRQDLPEVFSLNGAVYVGDAKELYSTKSFVHKNTAAYVMPKIRSVDIDDEIDLLVCKAILAKYGASAE